MPAKTNLLNMLNLMTLRLEKPHVTYSRRLCELIKEQGYITLFAGTYYPSLSTTEADSIFSLFKVTRDANHTITNIQRIQKVFNNPSYDSSNPASEKYLYSFNGNTPSGASANDQVFDVAGYLESVPQRNVVCYTTFSFQKKRNDLQIF